MDHGVEGATLEFALEAIRGGRAVILAGEAGPSFYIAGVTLPPHLGPVPCALRGPAVGDPPVTEPSVHYARRGTRGNLSRMVGLDPTTTQELTAVVIGGVLATIYGGPLAPRETSDPFLPYEERAASELFWASHALSDKA
jgi:hypothetical protein